MLITYLKCSSTWSSMKYPMLWDFPSHSSRSKKPTCNDLDSYTSYQLSLTSLLQLPWWQFESVSTWYNRILWRFYHYWYQFTKGSNFCIVLLASMNSLIYMWCNKIISPTSSYSNEIYIETFCDFRPWQKKALPQNLTPNCVTVTEPARKAESVLSTTW